MAIARSHKTASAVTAISAVCAKRSVRSGLRAAVRARVRTCSCNSRMARSMSPGVDAGMKLVNERGSS